MHKVADDKKSTLWESVTGVLHRREHKKGKPPLVQLADKLGQAIPVFEPPKYPTTNPPQVIKFDSQLWITTVTETATFDDVEPAAARRVFDSADPRNWNKYGPDFWQMSQQGELLLDGTWQPAKPDDTYTGRNDDDWRDPNKPKQIYEAVSWNWNEDFETSVENVLDIFFGHGEPALPLEAFKGRNPKYGYKYRLRECRGAELLDLFDQGGLDVDEGSFSVEYDRKRNSPGTLSVKASKSLHYSRQPCSPPAYDYFLNLMGPALISMLMTQLVVTGVQRVLANNIQKVTIERAPGSQFKPRGL